MSFVSKPQFCSIAPINFSGLVSGRSSHLVLAHLIDEDHHESAEHKRLSREYTAFIKEESDLGAFVMMDNSAYELKEPYAPEKLLELARKCGAHAIVLPDYPFQPSAKTIEAAEKFAPIFKAEGFKTFFVPQSKTGDIKDWIAAYTWAANNDLIDIIGISILGVPNAWAHIEPAYARVVAMQSLMENGLLADKHHHFLGLNAGPALEIPSLLRMGVLDTIDSSGPVWAAINGHSYTYDADSYQSVRKITNPVDFFLPLSKDLKTIERIEYNVRLTDDLFDPTVYEQTAPWYAEE